MKLACAITLRHVTQNGLRACASDNHKSPTTTGWQEKRQKSLKRLLRDAVRHPETHGEGDNDPKGVNCTDEDAEKQKIGRKKSNLQEEEKSSTAYHEVKIDVPKKCTV